MQIRRATKDDICDLMRLYHHLSNFYLVDNPEAVEAAILHPTTEVYVAEDGGRVVGTATVSFRAVPSHGLVALIDDVVADPECRGKGVGRALSEYCIEVARKNDACRVELTSHPSRAAANALYQRMGFIRRDTNSYFMLLSL